MSVVDYSYARPGGAALLAAGVTDVMRYAGSAGDAKNITAAEVADLHAHGIQIGIVVEKEAGFMLAGRERGRVESAGALADTRGAGLVDGVLYGAVDVDATLGGNPISYQALANMNAIAQTLAGFADTLGGWASVGCYCDYFAIDWLMAHTPCRHFWQPVAWSEGLRHPNAALFQEFPSFKINGGDCDHDTPHGDWRPRVPVAPVGKPSPSTEVGGRLVYAASMHQIGVLGSPVAWRGYIALLYPKASPAQVQQIAGICARDARNKAYLWYWPTGNLPGGARIYFPSFTV